MDWYVQLTQWLSVISEPIGQLYNAQQTPIIGALLLGLLGSLAPCQISANMGAISYSANRMSRGKYWIAEMISFFVGKTSVYLLLGLLLLFIGRELHQWAIPVFEIARYVMGPLFIVIGLYLLGLLRMRTVFTERLLQYEGVGKQWSGAVRAFLIGVILSLAFCPTMFVLFFGMLVPIMFAFPAYGAALPFVFSIGTFVPVLFFIVILFLFGINGATIRQSKRWGRVVQIGAGLVFIGIGIHDTIMYWMI